MLLFSPFLSCLNSIPPPSPLPQARIAEIREKYREKLLSANERLKAMGLPEHNLAGLDFGTLRISLSRRSAASRAAPL